MTPPLAAVPATDPAAADRALTARCPECEWKSGPFTSQRIAFDETRKHVNKEHRALIDFLRAKPLPLANERFARAVAIEAINHGGRLDQHFKQAASRIEVPGQDAKPIDLPAEIIAYIRTSTKAMACMLDVLLEMRTGDYVIEMMPPGEQTQQKQNRQEG